MCVWTWLVGVWGFGDLDWKFGSGSRGVLVAAANVLAGALGGAEAGGLGGGGGLVVLVGLLDEELDAAVLSGNDTDGLFDKSTFVPRSFPPLSPPLSDEEEHPPTHLLSDLALVLAAVDVPQVQRVARELDAVGALDQSGAVALGECPGEVVGDCGGHCVGVGW